jgi:hypothetical protein
MCVGPKKSGVSIGFVRGSITPTVVPFALRLENS